ncbi:hypothetical protein BD408DRAFT_418334 [Parasitella parasitica]|nr:hypothetical protein BD408DRAFT_418334 [Parasitella parasitica]
MIPTRHMQQLIFCSNDRNASSSIVKAVQETTASKNTALWPIHFYHDECGDLSASIYK